MVYPYNIIIGDRVRIENDVLIARSSFVNQDIPDHSIVIGNPCKVIPRENAIGNYIYHEV